MPSMVSFSVEVASISFGVLFSSSLIVPSLLVAYSADPGKRNVSPLKTIVVCFTLSAGKGFPSWKAATRFQVPCSLSKSVFGIGACRLQAAQQRTDGRDHQELRFHDVQSVDSCVAERKLRPTSIPSSRSVCYLLRPPGIRIVSRPCSGGTILVAWFENKGRRDKSRCRLSSSCRHHGLSRWPFFRL